MSNRHANCSLQLVLLASFVHCSLNFTHHCSTHVWCTGRAATHTHETALRKADTGSPACSLPALVSRPYIMCGACTAGSYQPPVVDGQGQWDVGGGRTHGEVPVQVRGLHEYRPGASRRQEDWQQRNSRRCCWKWEPMRQSRRIGCTSQSPVTDMHLDQ